MASDLAPAPSMSWKQQTRSLLGRALSVSRLHRLALKDVATIVAFHRVNDTIPEDGLTRGSRDFEDLCRLFRDNFDVLPLADMVSRLGRGASMARTLSITFDDGYLDNFEVAAPILKRLALPATFFVATHFLGSTTVPWWDEQLARQPGWMTWDHVCTLAREGFDIGAHTQRHVDLGKVSGADAQAEITGSHADILREIGTAPAHFAYPYGRVDNMLDSNRALVAAAGFTCCLSCHGGLARPGDDPFRLHRVPISPWYRTPQQFLFEVAARSA